MIPTLLPLFTVLDSIHLSDMQKRFNATYTPEVIRGDSDESEAFMHFAQRLCGFLDQGEVEVVTWDEFQAFYLVESIFYPHDDQFVTMVEQFWTITEYDIEETRVNAIILKMKNKVWPECVNEEGSGWRVLISLSGTILVGEIQRHLSIPPPIHILTLSHLSFSDMNKLF